MRTHSRLLTSRRVDDALDSRVRSQPGVLAGGGASVLIEICLGVLVLRRSTGTAAGTDRSTAWRRTGRAHRARGHDRKAWAPNARTDRRRPSACVSACGSESGPYTPEREPYAGRSLVGLPFFPKALTELAGCVLVVLCLCASAIGEWVVGLQRTERVVVRVEFVIGKGVAYKLIDDGDRLIGRIRVGSDALVAFGIGEIACELGVTVMGVGDLHRVGATVRTAFECVLDLLGGDRGGRAGHRPSPPMAVAL